VTGGRGFSRRTEHPEAQNALSLALAHARAAGRRVIDLTVSNPTRAGIPYDEAAILAALGDPRALVYEPLPFGLPEAREAVAREIPGGVDPSRVVLTASTSEAYAFLFKVLCDPGDEVLIPQPSYPLFEHLAAFEGVRPVPYLLTYEGEWHIDEASLAAAALSPRARAVLVVSPNNPTGSYLKVSEAAALAATGLPIVSDEVFATFPLDAPASRLPTALTLGAGGSLVFALGGLSKLAALPQMKLAWIAAAGPDDVVARALARLELVADTFLSVGTPVQCAAPRLLESRAAAEDAIRARTRGNLARLRAAVPAGSSLDVLRAEGGWYAVLRLPRVMSESEWTLALLNDADVYVHPGHFFDFPGEAYVVVSLLTPEEDFAEGATRIVSLVEMRAR
jgi:aspartate/methionine/tyrosine aminotransferase